MFHVKKTPRLLLMVSLYGVSYKLATLPVIFMCKYRHEIHKQASVIGRVESWI
jgi:hypothetical protein